MDEARNRNYVTVFDTTLRDGEQSPGATLNTSEKLEIAYQLSRLGVDVIEAGFPAASVDDARAVRRIAQQVGSGGGSEEHSPPIICALARTKKIDIESAWKAVEPAACPRVHTFLATSDVHLKHKLRMSRPLALACIEEMVAYARSLCDDVEFSPEDAVRSDPSFLYEVLEAAIEAGATTINIPDTVGYTTPNEFGRLIREIVARTCTDQVVVSIHCHNDLGMATANTLAALQAGAQQAEVTVNGIGERAGNAALEEVVMALRTRRSVYGMDTRINTDQIARTSRLVSRYTGLAVQANKSIVGANAFSHEAGIHQDGILKHQTTYEIIRPETVGLNADTRLVLGKHSGRHAFRVQLAKMGYELDEQELEDAFRRFKELADKKKHVGDADIEVMIADLSQQVKGGYHMEDLQVVCGRSGMPTATVKLLNPQGDEVVQSAVGTGPIDATYKAIDSVVQVRGRLVRYNVHAITEGIDAQGAVSVRLSTGDSDNRVVGGYGADTDIIVASAKAYLSAINRVMVKDSNGDCSSDTRDSVHQG